MVLLLRALWAAPALGLWGCGATTGAATFPTLVAATAVPASTKTPVVRSVRGLGGASRGGGVGRLPVGGASPSIADPLVADDGRAVVGETLLVDGEGFGRQPSVLVAGKAARVLARTAGAGLLIRVPPGVPTGIQNLTVRNRFGAASFALNIRRFAAVLPAQGGQVAWADIEAQGIVAYQTSEIAEADGLTLSADGRAAFVTSGARGMVTVFDLAANGGPQPVERMVVADVLKRMWKRAALPSPRKREAEANVPVRQTTWVAPGRVTGFLTAANRGLVVCERLLVFLGLTDALAPVVEGAVVLPDLMLSAQGRGGGGSPATSYNTRPTGHPRAPSAGPVRMHLTSTQSTSCCCSRRAVAWWPST